MKQGGKMKEIIQDYFSKGVLVQSSFVVHILKMLIVGKKGPFLIDGFPNSRENLQDWNKELLHHCNLRMLLFLICEEKTLIQRTKQKEDSLDQSNRLDTRQKKRMDIFKSQTLRLIRGFEKHGVVEKLNVTELEPLQVVE